MRRFHPVVACGRSVPSDAELTQQGVQRVRLLRHPMARGRAFLHHGGVLLSRLIHRIDRLVDFLEPGRLFAGRFHDRRDVVIYLLHLRQDGFQGGTGLADQRYAVPHMLA